MNKSYSPASIPTFYDGENMEEVRTKTINPLTQEVTRLGVKMNDLSLVSSSHANKISALESGSGVDLAPLTNRVSRVEQEAENLDIRVDILETDKLDMQVAIGGLDGRVTTLEANGGGGGGGSTTFRGLTDTPSTLEANKFVKVNAAGNALEFADAAGSGGPMALTDLTDTPASLVPNTFLKVNPAGTAFILDPHTHQGVDARQVMYTWSQDDLPAAGGKTVPQERVAQRSFFISATESTDRHVTFQMPGIARINAVPTDKQVPPGRLLMFTNTGGSNFILDTSTSGNQITVGIADHRDSITIGPGKFAQLMAVCNATGSHMKYHVVAAGNTTAFV